MRKILLILTLLMLAARPAIGQVVAQGQPAPTTDARAWPFKVVFGGAQIDPRDTSDRAGRLVGKITFDGAQAVTQSGAWAISFSSPQHVICDSGCLSAVADNLAFTFSVTRVSPTALVVDDVSTNVVAENNYGVPRMSPDRIPLFALTNDDGGNRALVTGGQALTVVDVSVFGALSSLLQAQFEPGFVGTIIPLAVGGVTNDGTPKYEPIPLGPSGRSLIIEGNASGVAVPVSVASLPLPSGAATSALQTTGNTSVASIDTKTPALGQQLAAASSPVVLTAIQMTALTPLTTLPTVSTITNVVHVDDNGGSLTVDGTVTTTPPANASTNITQVGGTSIITGGASGLLAVSGPVASAGTNADNPVKIGGVFNTTQPTVTNGQIVDTQNTARGAQIVATGIDAFTVAGSVTANAGTNLNTSALALDATLTGRTQKTQITDGTRDGTVKAASTLPALSDTAVVTTQRDPIPAGTNVIGHTINDTGSTTAVTGNVTVVQPTGTNLHTVCDSGCSSAAAFVDNAAFTFGTTTVANTGYVVDDVATNAVTENSSGAPRMTTARIAYSDISKSASNTNSFKVDFGAAAQPVTISAGSAVIGHVIMDTTSTTAVTQATATNLNAAVVGTGTAGSPAGNILTIQGVAAMTKLLVTPDSVALPANQSVNVAQIAGTNTVTGGVAGIIAVGGNVANAVAATANPVPVGGIFTTTPATLTTGQTATAQYTAAQNHKVDITTIAGTVPTTAGKLDIKGADGDVFVRNATAANLQVSASQLTPANLQATVTQLTLTKGTQGSSGVSTQQLHDAGRNTRIFQMDLYTVAPLVEAVESVVQWYGNAAVATTTQPAVIPAGKTLRLTGWKIMYQSIATAGYAVVRIRVNTAGLGVLASPLVASFEAGSAAAVAGVVTTEEGVFPEGLEIPAAAGLAFSMAGYGVTGALTLEGGVRFEVHGYEY